MTAAELIAHLQQVQPQARVTFYVKCGTCEGIELGVPVDAIRKLFTTAALEQKVPDVFDVELAGKWWSGGDVQALRDALRGLLNAVHGGNDNEVEDATAEAEQLLEGGK